MQDTLPIVADVADPSRAQGERKLAADGGRNLGNETPTAYRHDFDAKKTPATKEATKLPVGTGRLPAFSDILPTKSWRVWGWLCCLLPLKNCLLEPLEVYGI